MRRMTLLLSIFFTSCDLLQAQYWEPLGGGVSGFGAQVVTLCVDTFHHYLFAGGKFEMAGTIPANNLAIWNGTDWKNLSFEPDPVADLVMKSDTLVYAEGFATNNEIGMYVDTTFVGTLGSMGGTIYCLYVFHDTLYAGGEFNGGIKYWNGSQWKKVGGGVDGPYMQVHAIGSYNNELIVGGNFSDAGGVAVNNIAAWNGSDWSNMGGGVTDPSAFPDVFALQEYEGELYV